MFRIGGFEKSTFFKQQNSSTQNKKKIKNFFGSILFKYLTNSWVSWIGFNFYDNSDFLEKIGGMQ